MSHLPARICIAVVVSISALFRCASVYLLTDAFAQTLMPTLTTLEPSSPSVVLITVTQFNNVGLTCTMALVASMQVVNWLLVVAVIALDVGLWGDEGKAVVGVQATLLFLCHTLAITCAVLSYYCAHRVLTVMEGTGVTGTSFQEAFKVEFTLAILFLTDYCLTTCAEGFIAKIISTEKAAQCKAVESKEFEGDQKKVGEDNPLLSKDSSDDVMLANDDAMLVGDDVSFSSSGSSQGELDQELKVV